jgi:hypothetical protein
MGLGLEEQVSCTAKKIHLTGLPNMALDIILRYYHRQQKGKECGHLANMELEQLGGPLSLPKVLLSIIPFKKIFKHCGSLNIAKLFIFDS